MGMARRLLVIFLILFSTLALSIFILQNQEPTTLKLAIWTSAPYPLFLVLLIAFVTGIILAGVVSLVELLRMESRLRKTRRMLELLEREVDALRNQPLYEEPPRPGLVTTPTFESRFTHEGQPEDSLDWTERKKIR
ncbi:MAG TPA: LapA family protein [Bdellovibrionota bacterium]|nr:LapA family protein [Bdellovibrionota bacterium]